VYFTGVQKTEPNPIGEMFQYHSYSFLLSICKTTWATVHENCSQ